MVNKIVNFEQSDGSLLYPNGKIITGQERQKLITNSLNTPVRGREVDIKDIIKECSMGVLIGKTGSGKTTELPQMIHEVFPNDLIVVNIPLVSATIGTANYVSDILVAKTGNPDYIIGERGIGYRTGKGVSSKERSQMSFNTYGLDYLHLILGNYEKILNGTNKNIHIVLDEIHEKGEDFVFYLSKIIKLSKKYPGRIKIYGASATVSDNYLDKLVNKFMEISNEVPIIRVEGRTFPIEVIEDNGGNAVERIVELYKNGKSILGFEPGKGEIERTIKALKLELGQDIDIIPFHSEVSKEELKENLKTSGKQKIIIATNAARTGVTLDINSVVDTGKQKSLYYNEYGIPVLIEEDITFDAYMQNRGRAGRKEAGTAEYVGITKTDELKLEAPSSVEKKVDEKKILMGLIDGDNILKNESKGIHNYLFNPNKRMLTFSYEWMKKAGLITEDEKITKYGYDVLRFPISVFNGRIILESIENNVADDVIPMVSIIENKGFLTKEFNIKKFGKNILKNEYSDLEVYTKLFEILNSTKVDEDILKMFIGLGIDPNLINYFRSLDGEEKLYKVLGDDLDNVGLKLKNIERIDETIEKIKKYLESNKDYIDGKNVELDEKQKKEAIQKSLLSGNLHKIYTSIGKDKLVSYLENQKDLEFEKSDTSFLKAGSGELYIGEPFIIGGTGDKEDMPILSFLTLVEAGDIEYFESKKYTEYKVKKEKIKIKDFSTDLEGDTFVVPKEIISLEEKQKYLALNWLPYFLVEKNKFFKKFIENSSEDFDKDEFIKELQEYTLLLYKELNPKNKQDNIDKFTEDKKILGLVLQSKKIKPRNDKGFKKNIKIEDLETENSNFFNYIESLNDYNKTLEEAQNYIRKNSINTNLITDEILNSFINTLEYNSEDYSKLVLFLNEINLNNNNNSLKRELKELFISFKKDNKKLLILKKRNSWVMSFLNNLKELRKGKEIKIKDFSIGTIDDDKLLFSDPIIKENNFGDRANFLQNEFKQINKLVRKINLDESKTTKLVSSLQRLLFSDTRKFNRGLSSYETIMSEISAKKDNNLEKISNLNISKNSINAEETNKKIKELNILNTNIGLLVSRLTSFKEATLSIRSDIKKINFDDIIFNSKNKNSIYTKKFLYNILINIIFEGNFIVIDNKQKSKLSERIDNNLKGDNGNINNYNLIELIKNIGSGNHDIPKNKLTNKTFETEKSPYFELDNYILKIEDILSKYKKENKEVELSILEKNQKVISIISSMRGILLEFYPEEIVKVHENKILNFAKNIANFKKYNIDEELKKLISSMPLIKSIKFNNSFLGLDEYMDLSKEIMQLKKFDGLEENEENNFVLEREKFEKLTEKIKEKTLKIKGHIGNNKK